MVDPDAVAHVARLARLHFEQAELDRFVAELSNILAHVEELRSASVAGVEAVGSAAEGNAPLRRDEPGADPLHEPPSAFAPDWVDGFFTVPRLAALDAEGEAEP